MWCDEQMLCRCCGAMMDWDYCDSIIKLLLNALRSVQFITFFLATWKGPHTDSNSVAIGIENASNIRVLPASIAAAEV